MNKANRQTLAEMARRMKADDDFLILTHRRPDGDTVGSAVALCIALRRLGKRAYVCANPEAPERLQRYLAPYEAQGETRDQTVVTVDIPSYTQMEPLSRRYSGEIDYIIDHHVANQMTARKGKVDDPSAAATGEIVYELICQLGVPLDAELAAHLYISISTDTGCFLYSNTTAATHELAAACIRAGIDLAALNMEFFEKKRRARFEMERLVYNGLRFYCGGRIAAITVTQQMRRDTGATEDDIDDFSSIPRKIEGVRAGISAYEQPDGSTKISVRTSGDIDAAAVCAAFHGGGHLCAAGCNLALPPEQAIEAVCAEVGKRLFD
ncbi:MAG: exopolyphosphatase [Clostridiales bacterium]|nr:MAG: exopolyphosphatase [Clostridiales bacterium]